MRPVERFQLGLAGVALVAGIYGWKQHRSLLPGIPFLVGAVGAQRILNSHIYPASGYCELSQPKKSQLLALSTPSGEVLRGVHFHAENAKGVLVGFAALGSNSEHLHELGALARDNGWDVKLLDIRGYGESDGSPSPEAHAEDVNAIVQSLEDYQNIAVYGHCAGGPLAAHAAALAKEKLHCLILDRFMLRLPFVFPNWLYPGYDTEEACKSVPKNKITTFRGAKDWDPASWFNKLPGVEPFDVENCGHFRRWWLDDCPAQARLLEILGA